MTKLWTCKNCRRKFAQKNQRHACGTGSRSQVLHGRPDSLIMLYASLESFANSLGPVEFVTRERYVLLRTLRIFADLTVQKDLLRVVVHLNRAAQDPLFFKIASARKRFSHVAKLHDEKELEALKPYLREAYMASLSSI